MKAKKILLMMTMAASLTACNQQTTGLKLENMDTTVKPGTDFYQYACGGWIKNNPLKPEYSSYGSFDVVVEENQKRIRELIEDLASKPQEQGSLGQKIGDLYALRMDSVRQNKEGVKPVLADMERVAKVKTTEELMTLLNQMNTEGVAFGELWGYYVGADMMVSTQNLLELSQGGYSIERDYYVKDDEANKKILEAYKKHVVKMFQLVGETADAAQQKMENVLKVEMRMAKAGRDNVALRDPASNYHKMSFADFQKDYEGFDWKTYFDMQGMTDIDSLSVGQPEAVKEALAVLKDTPVEVLKDFFLWQILDSSGGILGDKVYEEVFDFEGRILTGAKEPRPRWKRSVSAVNGILGEAVGQMYVEKYFPPANKARMEELIKNLQTALGERIDAQEWMSESTKKAAHEKLDAFYVKVGYPDKWRDYSKMNIDPQKSLYENMKEVAKWAHADMLARKWKKPVDRDEWHMTPQTVNAYYNPTTNEICFPAGILQPPFFSKDFDDAVNYGAIGVVIGHEMTHGFDDQGRQYDKEGNLRQWWADADVEAFKIPAEQMAVYFDSLWVIPGELHSNGHQCLGENLADHGGLNIAFQALQLAKQQGSKTYMGDENGFTPEQRFFLSYANVWAGVSTEEILRRLALVDVHSANFLRVNGGVAQCEEWYKAFDIKEGDKLYVAPENRVNIW